MSKTQLNGLLNDLRMHITELTDSQKAELATSIAEIPWNGFDDQNVQTLLSNTSAWTNKRREGQDFLSFPDFILEESWNYMYSDDATSDAVLAELIRSLKNSGGRTVGERTLKLLNSLHMFITLENPIRMDYVTKQSKLKRTKKEWHNIVDKETAPIEWIDKLPPSPFELSRKFPLMYRQLFKRYKALCLSD